MTTDNYSSDKPPHRLPLKTKRPTSILRQEVSMSANATTWNTTWIAMAIIFLVIVVVAVVMVMFDADTQCEREANGYPLISFQIDGTGDEINCRYGTETD